MSIIDNHYCVFQSDESIYERECGNMPGFAVYYRYPNSQRVTYGQFIKVHCLLSHSLFGLNSLLPGHVYIYVTCMYVIYTLKSTS